MYFDIMDIESIVKRCQAGDREAFGIIYQTYLTPMHDIVAYYVHNSEAIRDILHDGFIIAFESIDTLKDQSKVKAWLTTIMKNLALQYLKDLSGHTSVPMSNLSLVDNSYYDQQKSSLTWDELNKIISKLPEGYGKVFRLAVLDGLSHKEIGTLLDIAPHSSSSQLTHAKDMLRRMIVKYRIEMGVLSIIGIALLLWHGIFRHREEIPSIPIISKNTDEDNPPVFTDSIGVSTTDPDSIIQKNRIKKIINSRQPELIANMTKGNDNITVIDSIKVNGNDSIVNDTIIVIPKIIDNSEVIAKEYLPQSQSDKNSDWSMSLAGNFEQSELNQYLITYSNIPGMEDTNNVIEIKEKTHHYKPLVIGLSVNKSFSSRWSVETGLRYTFLRSDFLSESELLNKEISQRIHYLGVPLKINYRICTYNGFSLYGQGGGALDIPVNGSQNILEYSPTWNKPYNHTIQIHAPMQWSVEGGIGLQYYFTPTFSIYTEPSIRYYFNTGSDIKTIRQEKPLEFTMPIGLRVIW